MKENKLKYRKCPHCKRTVPASYNFNEHKKICKNVPKINCEGCQVNIKPSAPALLDKETHSIQTKNKNQHLVTHLSLKKMRKPFCTTKEARIKYSEVYLTILSSKLKNANKWKR